MIPEVGHLIHYETPHRAANSSPISPPDTGERAEGTNMKLMVDARYTRIGFHDGISRYTALPCWARSKPSLTPVTSRRRPRPDHDY